MSQNNKVVLVLEKSSENLGVSKEGNEVVLEGIFAQFGVVNNNDRIYEEAEYLPHLDYLQKKISEKRLLGELDHPEKFDISLSKVSHVVEKLEYDKSKRQIRGRVRLLDTPPGRIAKELVEAGVPISISSRAAGLVESNKKVKIKRIFTYDLVADPGFNEAILHRMNESLGILNENVAIYDVTSEYPELLEDFNTETETKQTKNSENMDYVTSEELNTYSLVLKEEIEGIHKKMESLGKDSEMSKKFQQMSESIEKMQSIVESLSNTVTENTKYNDYLAEKLDRVIDYADYVAKTLDESIQYTNHVAEKADHGIQYAEYVKEHVEKHIEYSDYLREQIEKGVEYSEYLKECIEQGVSYAEYVAENLDNNIEFGKKLEEKANSTIAYAEYVANEASEISEKLEDSISYANYLSESLNNGIEYTEYIGEQTQQLADYTEFMLNENGLSKKETEKQEIIKESKSTDYSNLSGKVDELIESIKKQKVDEASMAITETRKEKVSNELNESNQQVEVQEKWLTDAPEEYKAIWESLDPGMKNAINAQSKFYKLETEYQIKNFWETRKLTKVEKPLNESETPKTNLSPLGYDLSYLDAVKAGLDKFGRN